LFVFSCPVFVGLGVVVILNVVVDVVVVVFKVRYSLSKKRL